MAIESSHPLEVEPSPVLDQVSHVSVQQSLENFQEHSFHNLPAQIAPVLPQPPSEQVSPKV